MHPLEQNLEECLADLQKRSSLLKSSRKACKTSRAVHMDVWLHLLPKELVKRFIRVLRRIAKCIPDNKRQFDRYRDNIQSRIQSLRNYLAGKPPVVPRNPTKEEYDALLAAYPDLKKKYPCKTAKVLARMKKRKFRHLQKSA